MYRGFPIDLLTTLRCPDDAGRLQLRDEAGPPGLVESGELHCDTCQRSFPVQRGIACFLDTAALDSESDNERARRDEGAQQLDPSWETTPWNQMEIIPTTEASEPLGGALVLELGAGTGRYTVQMAERGAAIVAVDFSGGSLDNLAGRVKPHWRIGLVQADCTRFAVAPASFDLIASTLVSNLPTRQHRAAMMKVAAQACRPTGKFVFSTHFYGIRSRLRREPQSGYYREAPIYRYLFRRSEIEHETLPHFGHVTCHPIQIALPFVARVGLSVVKLSRATEHVPLLNQFGELLLVTARQPLTS